MFGLQISIFVLAAILTGIVSSKITETRNVKDILSQALKSKPYIEDWPDALNPELQAQVYQLDERYFALSSSLQNSSTDANQARQEMSKIFLEYAQILNNERFDLKSRVPEQAESLDRYIEAIRSMAPRIRNGDPDVSDLINGRLLSESRYSFPL